jgi:alpha-amylase/alpha-mannosidase (GH57 family)
MEYPVGRKFSTMVNLYEDKGFIWVMDKVKVTERALLRALVHQLSACRRSTTSSWLKQKHKVALPTGTLSLFLVFPA